MLFLVWRIIEGSPPFVAAIGVNSDVVSGQKVRIELVRIYSSGGLFLLAPTNQSRVPYDRFTS